MNFYELLILAKSGDDLANEKILAMYQPLLTKESVIYGCKGRSVSRALHPAFPLHP